MTTAPIDTLYVSRTVTLSSSEGHESPLAAPNNVWVQRNVIGARGADKTSPARTAFVTAVPPRHVAFLSGSHDAVPGRGRSRAVVKPYDRNRDTSGRPTMSLVATPILRSRSHDDRPCRGPHDLPGGERRSTGARAAAPAPRLLTSRRLRR